MLKKFCNSKILSHKVFAKFFNFTQLFRIKPHLILFLSWFLVILYDKFWSSHQSAEEIDKKDDNIKNVLAHQRLAQNRLPGSVRQ
jgi:hypothetical protein